MRRGLCRLPLRKAQTYVRLQSARSARSSWVIRADLSLALRVSLATVTPPPNANLYQSLETCQALIFSPGWF